MRFVDDEDAVARFGGGIHGAVTELAHVIYAAVTCGIELGNVEVAGPVGGKRNARVAFATRSGGGAFDAVQGARHNACRRRLSAATWTREKVGVVNSATVQCHR